MLTVKSLKWNLPSTLLNFNFRYVGNVWDKVSTLAQCKTKSAIHQLSSWGWRFTHCYFPGLTLMTIKLKSTDRVNLVYLKWLNLIFIFMSGWLQFLKKMIEESYRKYLQKEYIYYSGSNYYLVKLYAFTKKWWRGLKKDFEEWQKKLVRALMQGYIEDKVLWWPLD